MNTAKMTKIVPIVLLLSVSSAAYAMNFSVRFSKASALFKRVLYGPHSYDIPRLQREAEIEDEKQTRAIYKEAKEKAEKMVNALSIEDLKQLDRMYDLQPRDYYHTTLPHFFRSAHQKSNVSIFPHQREITLSQFDSEVNSVIGTLYTYGLLKSRIDNHDHTCGHAVHLSHKIDFGSLRTLLEKHGIYERDAEKNKKSCTPCKPKLEQEK